MRISDWSSDVCSSDLSFATTPAPHRIIFANEKGGTGKSTCAVHFAVALASQGWRVAGLDLAPRQRTFHRYLEKRPNPAPRRDITLPTTPFQGFRSDERPVGKGCVTTWSSRGSPHP